MRERIQYDHPHDLIKGINPAITPEEAVERVRLFNESEFNETQRPVVEARAELVRRAGNNPEDWVFYSHSYPLGKGTEHREEELKRIAEPFPDGVEFLMVNGGVLGGFHGELGSGFWSVAKYMYLEDCWSVFIRVKKRLPGKGF
jgi:hypothetical protein